MRAWLPLIAAALSVACTRTPAGRAGVEDLDVVDTHVHVLRDGEGLNAGIALPLMDAYRVRRAIALPPPYPVEHERNITLAQLADLARAHPGRFAFVAGGESLNPMLQATAPDAVSPEALRRFVEAAEGIAAAGAAGFGELALEHLSLHLHHPYEAAAPDHPLLLALADVAARHGMPIDLHMEAVPRPMPYPFPRRPSKPHPETLQENIPAFERLLAHQRGAKIVWAHAGWDLTGERTPALMRELLERHPNLHMSLKLDRGDTLNSPMWDDGTIKASWLELFRAFPDRFVMGCDQFFDGTSARLIAARAFVQALPPDLARRIARENPARIYRLPAGWR